MNLETAIAQPLTLAGPVFSNGGIWSGSTTLTFANTVSAVGLATNTPYDPFCIGYTGSGKSTYLIKGQPKSGVSPLYPFAANTYQNPVLAKSFLNLPPSTYQWGTASAFSINGQFYLANETDLFVTNTSIGTNWGASIPRGTNLFVYYQDGNNGGQYETWITNDFYILNTGGTTNYISPQNVTNIRYAGYSFLTNVVFYDWREGYNGGAGMPKKVQAVQLDINRFNNWLLNTNVNGGAYYNAICGLPGHKSHPIDSIYIYNAVPLTGSVLPAVRVINGTGMPSADGTYGFTLATAQPIYVFGNYNATNSLGSSLGSSSVIYTEPAALMGDAITILSPSWNDATLSMDPSASQTTINAACIAGIVESDTNNTASTGNGYSGGVENFLRLLENWSVAPKLYYNGSIVALFPSQYATNCWQQTGHYYTAPYRVFAFDTNFDSNLNLPPLTPMVANYTVF